MVKRIEHLLINYIIDYLLSFRRMKKFGLGYRDFLCMKNGRGCINNKISKIQLFGKTLKRKNSYWYTHSIIEIFKDETYKFKSSNPKPLIIDCGANIGLSIIYFKQLFSKARIIAFEPDSEIFELCKYNCSQFNLQDIELVNAAVWSESGEFYFHSDGALGGHIVEKETDSYQKVSAVKLSSYLNQRVDFLKIDIEGAEYEVLESCQELLKNVEKLFVEYHSVTGSEQKLDKILEIITSAGFKYYIKEAWETMQHPYLNFSQTKNFDLQLNIFAYRK